MKKSLIVLAIAGAFAAPVAMADTTIYGAANVSLDAVNNGAVTSGASANNVSSNVSKIGFKGSEDLGNGLSAVYQIEQQIAMDTGALNTATTRNTFAGLSSGSMGTVILGVHDTPYKLATRDLDLFADTIADNRSIMGNIAGVAFLTAAPVSHDARLGNVVAYISPAMSGLTVAAATIAGAETPISPSTKGSAWSLAGMYNAGPINASLSYQSVNAGTGGTGTAGAVAPVVVDAKFTAWKLGGSYTMDQFQVNAIYENTKDSGSTVAGAADTFGRKAWYLAGKYNVSASDAVKAAYTSAGKTGAAGTADTDATQFSVGYDHSMSKRTTVYALYSKISNKAAAAYAFSGTTATSAAAANGGTDADPSAWSIGMKHTF